MSYTIIIIAVTVLISLAAFTTDELMSKLILWPKKMNNPAEYYRLLTSGFIHADWMHLFFNMYTLYAFGATVENVIHALGYNEILFLIMYLSGIVVASLPSFVKNRHNGYYRSLGASGGVASIIFFTIYYFPWNKISIVFFPIGIYSVVFGGLYLAYEAYMSKRGAGNVNHDAHFWGSVFGLLFALTLDPSHGKDFIYTITHPR
jgi:membrane associated rhomboid family serine protease